MRCSKCGSDNREGRKFCTSCGTPLSAVCPKCGASIQPDESFCGECGASLSATTVASQIPAAETAPDLPLITERAHPFTTVEGERKTVTALFADLKGSTELMRDVDPEVARAIIDPALKIMVEAVRYYDGYVVQSTGDGIFALFGAPLAHEDHPQRSIYAGLRMQEGLRSYAERLSMESKPAVVARVGVNSGEVVMRAVETGGRFEYTPVGYVTNLASGMETAAPAGGIAISAETQRLVEGYVELRALGLTELKGVAEPIQVYEVVGLGPLRTHFEVSTRRGLTKFVGRERELAQIRNAMELASSGHGQVVGIVADAGAGKSRLVHEFKAQLQNKYKLLEAYSVSYGKASAWLPVLELLRDYFGIETTDDTAARREKVRTALRGLDPGLSDTLPYLLGLLGLQETPDPLAQMDPQIRQRRTRHAITKIIAIESVVQPVVVIFEDLHWIDGETQALLDLVADSIAAARVLLLVNYRPEYRHQWANKSYYSQLRLDALGRESASDILAVLLGESTELDGLKHLMIERTQGNPFFIEEMVQALFDEGALARNGTVKVMRPLGQLRMPPTVQGILAARIDRLPMAEKNLLQTLAVVGRQAPLAVITEIVGGPQIERMLRNLQTGEFIYEQTASDAAVVYEFKHALTQEVAYNSLLIERRKLFHERAGAAIESLYGGQLDDHVSELARHYSNSENVHKAVEYLGKAGNQAMQRSAHIDAINNFNAAIELLKKLPAGQEHLRQELTLQLALGPAMIPVNGWASPVVERTFTRARELCELLDDSPDYALHGLWVVRLLQRRFPAAFHIAEELLQRAESASDQILLMFAHVTVGATAHSMGKFVLGREHLEKALTVCGHGRYRALSVDMEVVCSAYLAQAFWILGYPDRALKLAEDTMALAQRLSDPSSHVFAQTFASLVYSGRGELEAAKENVESMYSLCIQHGFSYWLGSAQFERLQVGRMLVKQGHRAEGIAQIHECLAAVRATVDRSDSACLLAEVYTETGRLDDALAVLKTALTAVDEDEDRLFEAELHRLIGELSLRRDNPNIAETQTCFERAIKIARNQTAKSLELRAVISFARLLASQGRRDQARSMMSEIYDWFTEGFDTADLKEAKALLDELNR